MDSTNNRRNSNHLRVTITRLLALVAGENTIILAILIGLVVLIAGITGGDSIRFGNISNILLQSSIRGMVAIGQGLVLLTANLDLSVGGMATMITLLGAATLTGTPKYCLFGHPMGLWCGLSVMGIAGLTVGFVNGISVTRLHMPSLIVTLCTWQIALGIAYQVGQGRSVASLPPSLAIFGQGEIAGVPVPVIMFPSIAIIVYVLLKYTPFGRSIYAVGGNPASSYLAGIKVRGIIFTVFLISGFLSALAGLIILSRTMSGSMLVAQGLELDSIAACVVGGVSLFGGRGNLVGIIIGVLIVGVLNNGMNLIGWPPTLQDIAKGGVILIAVGIDSWRRREI
jgi:ribose/xylose/arabinose/galactoside ABC-type transport system permease subunit